MAPPPVDTSLPYVAFNPIAAQPWHFFGLELLIIGCGIVTLLHALRAHARGDAVPLFTWSMIVTYGLIIEVLSYNFLDNYTQAQFSVMLYHRELPLYVVFVYVVFLYTGIMVARRMGLPAWAEPFAAGLLIVCFDFPYDILGPAVGWWVWSNTDPLLAFRWLDVPVTSYLWHTLFGGVAAVLVRWNEKRVRAVGFARSWWRVLLAAVGILVGGAIVFLPYHGAVALGVSPGAFLAFVLVVCAVVVVFAPRATTAGFDRVLLGIVAVHYPFFLLVLTSLWSDANQANLAAKTSAILAATLGAVVLHAMAQFGAGAGLVTKARVG